jgi:hypothetical protein
LFRNRFVDLFRNTLGILKAGFQDDIGRPETPLLRVESFAPAIQFELGLSAVFGAIARPTVYAAELRVRRFDLDLDAVCAPVTPCASSGPESGAGALFLTGS